MPINIQALTNKAVEFSLSYGPKLLLSLIVLIVGFKVVNVLTRSLNSLMQKRDVDKSLRPFLISLLSIFAKFLILVSVASMIGVETTSFVAVLGAAGLAVGLALQGSLANFAGGILILIFKPFVVGDYIHADDIEGSVEEIQIFITSILTLDGKLVFVPNGTLSNNKITNYTRTPTRRIEFSFGIGYEESIDKAEATIRKVIAADNRILKEPAPVVGVVEHGDSSINFTVLLWSENKYYWPLKYSFSGAVKKAFDAENIEIPFPQRVVHMKQG